MTDENLIEEYFSLVQSSLEEVGKVMVGKKTY